MLHQLKTGPFVQLNRGGVPRVDRDLEPFAAHLTRVVWVGRGGIAYDGPPTEQILAAASEPFSHHEHGDSHRESMPDDLRTGR